MMLQTEGVEIRIEWHLLKPNSSFFIPAIQVTKLAKDVRKAALEKGVRLTHKACVYNGMYGVRFWRVA